MSIIQYNEKHTSLDDYIKPEVWSKGKILWVKNNVEDPWFECRFHHFQDGKVFVFLPRENSSRNIDFNIVTAENMLGKELLSVEEIL